MSSLTALLTTSLGAMIQAVIPSILVIIGLTGLNGVPFDIKELVGIYTLVAFGYLVVMNFISYWGASRATSELFTQMFRKFENK